MRRRGDILGGNAISDEEHAENVHKAAKSIEQQIENHREIVDSLPSIYTSTSCGTSISERGTLLRISEVAQFIEYIEEDEDPELVLRKVSTLGRHLKEAMEA